ncbi:MAG: Trk system potassium transporter TrkA [Alphaproteobacteria bacterium]|nr:Trk system potassium transporter TrkA [Alphaproteobacteria bacterium]
MKILILGAGQTGFGIAQYLKDNDIDVTLIERSRETALAVRNKSNLDVVIGNATDAEVLKSADIENADRVIATMSSDEQNLVACKIISALFNVPTKIARVKSPAFLRGEVFDILLKDSFDVDVLLQPELEISSLIADIIQTNGALDVINSENVAVVKLRCRSGTEIINTTFKHFQEITDLNLFVINVTRQGRTFFPSSSDILLPDDDIYLITTPKQLNAIMTLFGYPQQEKHKLLIIGSGNIGTALLYKLIEEKPNYEITVLENSIERAEKIALNFPNANVVHGDALKHSVLKELALKTDTAAVLTDKDSTNVIAAQLLKQLGVNRVLALTKTNDYKSLLSEDSGCFGVNAHEITIQAITQKLSSGKTVSITELRDKTSNIVQATVTESCPSLGNTIESIKVRNRIMPAFIIREGNLIFARGHHILELNDELILSVITEDLPKIKKMFPQHV